MSRLHLNVGRTHGATPRALVGAITGESGISGQSIGAIDIRNAFSVVEVAAELAEGVLVTLNKGVFISGVRISAKMDEGPDPAPRRAFKPGPRRQPSAKFKKPRGSTTGRKQFEQSQDV